MYPEMKPRERFANEQQRPCPLCDESAFGDTDQSGATLIVCCTCGKFRYGSFGDIYLGHLSSSKDKHRYRLSHIMRSISQRALGKRDNSFFPKYSDNDFEKMLERPDPSVQEKLHLLLQYLGSLSEYPGQTVNFDNAHDYSVLCAKNSAEADFYMQSLSKRGFLSLEPPTMTTLPRFTLSTDGWVELDKISQSGGESSHAFIAMWFDESRAAFDKAIEIATRSAGYIPVRIDRVEHLNRIDDEIIARIREAKFLIADFTQQRNGVYFEAGFMLGLGRPVIWLCEKSDLVNLHFDTRQYNTIDYSDADDLRTRLQSRIEANLGKGPHTTS